MLNMIRDIKEGIELIKKGLDYKKSKKEKINYRRVLFFQDFLITYSNSFMFRSTGELFDYVYQNNEEFKKLCDEYYRIVSDNEKQLNENKRIEDEYLDKISACSKEIIDNMLVTEQLTEKDTFFCGINLTFWFSAWCDMLCMCKKHKPSYTFGHYFFNKYGDKVKSKGKSFNDYQKLKELKEKYNSLIKKYKLNDVSLNAKSIMNNFNFLLQYDLSRIDIQNILEELDIDDMVKENNKR